MKQLDLIKFIYLITMIVCFNTAAYAGETSGQAKVVDGDTIEINHQRIRLEGIDAPESAQTCEGNEGEYLCGEKSREVLNKIIGENEIRCIWEKYDSYGRQLAECFVGKNNINEALVKNGNAVAYRYFSEKYVALEDKAKKQKIGVWQGAFIMPWDYRRQCTIKGNISQRGERIYHTKESTDYKKTVISGQKGEKWFCSEAEAKAAGWRKAKIH